MGRADPCVEGDSLPPIANRAENAAAQTGPAGARQLRLPARSEDAALASSRRRAAVAQLPTSFQVCRRLGHQQKH